MFKEFLLDVGFPEWRIEFNQRITYGGEFRVIFPDKKLSLLIKDHRIDCVVYDGGPASKMEQIVSVVFEFTDIRVPGSLKVMSDKLKSYVRDYERNL